MLTGQKPFQKNHLEGEIEKQDIVAVRLNPEERKELNEIKEDLNIASDSKAIKISGLKIGRNVLQALLSRPTLRFLFKNDRQKLEDFKDY